MIRLRDRISDLCANMFANVVFRFANNDVLGNPYRGSHTRFRTLFVYFVRHKLLFAFVSK